MFCALNITLRRHRRRLAVLAVVLGLAGTVVVAHSAISHDGMASTVVTCLAVAETAVAAAGLALALGAFTHRPLWLVPAPLGPALAFNPRPVDFRARAGPPVLQVFRR